MESCGYIRHVWRLFPCVPNLSITNSRLCSLRFICGSPDPKLSTHLLLNANSINAVLKNA